MASIQAKRRLDGWCHEIVCSGAWAGASGAPRRALLAAGGSGKRSTWRSAGLAEAGSAGRSRVRSGPGVPDRGPDTRDRGSDHL